MLEHYRQPLAPLSHFIRRVMHGIGVVLILASLSLCAGTVGYRTLENMPWIDAFYNASLIMSGMGPVTELETEAGKIFASLYSLFSGLFLVATIGLLLVPVIHRMLHRLHYEDPEKGSM